MLRLTSGRPVAVLTLAVACLASSAAAQGSMSLSGTILVATGDPARDFAGVPIPNQTISTAIEECALDEQGNVFFRALMFDSVTPLTGVNAFAYFHGASRTGLVMAVRGGDPAPGLAPTILLRTSAGSSTSLSAAVRLSPDGELWWASKLYDGGVTVTSANDDALFSGPLGSQAVVLRDGEVADGTGGALFGELFASAPVAFFGKNRNGVMYLRAALATGTGTPAVVTTFGANNSQGLWVGPAGALTLVARKSTPIQGLGGEVGIDGSTAITSHVEINDLDNVLFEVALSTTQGSPAATATNDRALMVHTPGSGNQVLVREGDTAPGTAGGTFNSIAATNLWAPGLAQSAWTRTNEVVFVTELRGGNTVSGVNDRAIYRGGVGTLALVARRGDAAPGTGGATWAGFTATSALHDASGRVAFQGFLNLGGAVTSFNSTGIWAGLPGNLQLVVRENDVLPGTGGSRAGTFNGAKLYTNDAGQVLFQTLLSGGTSAGEALFVWDAIGGVRPVLLTGDVFEVNPGDFRTVNAFGGLVASNTDGATLSFGHDGKLALRLNFTDGTSAIVVERLVPGGLVTPFCFGDGLDAAHTTNCPCGNTGAAGNGCGNSVVASGANLSTTGTTGLDTIALQGSGMPASVSCIYLQGTALDDAVFGDGVRCTGGTLLRLRTRTNVSGASAFPDSTDTITLSARGGVSPGSGAVRYYQTYYRNSAALYCPPETFNVTNGIVILW
ncbi:MAG: hypothetical protein IPJ77_00430 [Planctomycetes bacterium]|nr:hypothetical protein [Planctomycetota bacterium]